MGRSACLATIVLLLGACGPRLIASDGTSGDGDGDGDGDGESGDESGTTGQPPTDLPAPPPACESFGQTGPARVVSDELARYKFPGGILTGSDGMLAVWRRGFNGSNPDPNLMARRLDADGYPVGDSFALTTRNVTNGPYVRPSSGGHGLLTQCARFGAEDYASPLRIDVDGGIVNDMFVIPPESQHCGAHDPMGIWTGQRHLVAWTDNSSYQLRLASMDEQLGDVAVTELAAEGDLSAAPRFAIAADGTIALVAGLRLGPLSLWLLGQDGELLGPPTELEFEFGDESQADLAVTPLSSGGFVVWVVGRWDGGLHRFGVDGDGTIDEGLGSVPGWEDWLLDNTDVVAAPGGHMMVFTTWDYENNFISWAHLDEDGVLGAPQVFDDELDDFFTAWPRLNRVGGRVFMEYGASLGELVEDSDIRVAEFGCLD